MEPVKGSIAVCQAGLLGLILAVVEDHTLNNVTTKVYRGIHLSEGKFGRPWQSINPVVVGHINEVCSHYQLSRLTSNGNGFHKYTAPLIVEAIGK